MKIVYIIGGIALGVPILLNMRCAAEALCRAAVGFFALLGYNMISAAAGLAPVGVNALSAMIVGFLGLPGGALLVAAEKFL